MKKLYGVMAVVLGVVLVFSVVGLAKNDVLCKATGGTQLDASGHPFLRKVTLTFNGRVYDNDEADGVITILAHPYEGTPWKAKARFETGTCIPTQRMDLYGTDESGNEVVLKIGDKTYLGWDAVWFTWEGFGGMSTPLVGGGNIVVHCYSTS